MDPGRTRRWMAVLVLVAGMLVPAVQAPAAEDMDILHEVQTAKTASDHQAIASYYDAQAADAKKNAELHRKMADTYKAGGTSIGKGGGPVPMPQHCQALAKMFDDEAAHYASMAQTHRDLAKTIK
jgi:hypothetical protein